MNAAEVVEALRSRIRSGDVPGALRSGEDVPTNAELCDTYNVSSATATKVTDQLKREGLIARQGRRLVVLPPLPLQRLTSDRYRPRDRNQPDGSYTYERAMPPGWRASTHYVSAGFEEPPAWAARLLDLGERTAVHRSRRRVAWFDSDRQQVAYTIGLFSTWLPPWVADKVPIVLHSGKVGVGGSYSRIEETLGPLAGVETVRCVPVVRSTADAFGWRDTLGHVSQVERVIRLADTGQVVSVDREDWRPGFVEHSYPLAMSD